MIRYRRSVLFVSLFGNRFEIKKDPIRKFRRKMDLDPPSKVSNGSSRVIDRYRLIIWKLSAKQSLSHFIEQLRIAVI